MTLTLIHSMQTKLEDALESMDESFTPKSKK